MEASQLHAFARRRLADNPEQCPVDGTNAALMLAWLAGLETEADLDRAAAEEAFTAEREAQQAEMAAAFRGRGQQQSAGRGQRPAAGRGQQQQQQPAGRGQKPAAPGAAEEEE